jgi:hypothetical protein
MFEAKLSEGAILKKIVESIKDIVTDVNIDISPSGKFHYRPIHYGKIKYYQNSRSKMFNLTKSEVEQ